MFKRILPFIIPFMALPPALGQDAPPPPPTDRTYAPEARFTVNDLLKYKMTMSFNLSIKSQDGKPLPVPIPTGDNKVDSVITMKTVGVKPDGTGVVVTKMTGGRASIMGTSMDTPGADTAITMEVDRHGKIVKMRGMEKMPGAAMFGSFMNMSNMPGQGVVLPDHPVKIGDTWELDTPFPLGDQKMHISNTLVSTERIAGQETLRIKQVMTIPFDLKLGQEGPVKDDSKAFMVMTGSMSANSIQNILESNARIIRSTGEMNGKIFMTIKGTAAKEAEQAGFAGPINMEIGGNFNMDLLSAGKVSPQTAPAPKPRRKSPNG